MNFLKLLREINQKRDREVFGQISGGWGLSEWGCELGGEAGEVLDAIKKINRIGVYVPCDHDREIHELSKEERAIAEEIGDTLICLDLLAGYMGLDLEEVTRYKFNKTSDKRGTDIKL